MILVDTSVWIHYFCGHSTPEVEKLASLLGNEPVAIGDLILAEILQGFKSDKDYKSAENVLTSLTVFNMLDTNIAIKSADNNRFFRKKGITIGKSVDSIIVTFCIQYQLPILHCDKDFLPFQKHPRLKNVL